MTMILGIAGSPTAPSRSTAVVRTMLGNLEQRGYQIELLAVRDLDADELLKARWDGATIKAAIQQVSKADGIIIATPIYKAAYTGILKAFLDLLPRQAFKDKVILPMATAGSLLHKLALDYALNPVLSELGSEVIVRSLYLTDPQIAYDDNEAITRMDPEADERIRRATTEFIDLLSRMKNTQNEFVNA